MQSDAEWLDITYALRYAVALRLVEQLRPGVRSPKYWRPSIVLVLPGQLCGVSPLASLICRISSGGTFVLGRLLPYPVGDISTSLENAQAELSGQARPYSAQHWLRPPFSNAKHSLTLTQCKAFPMQSIQWIASSSPMWQSLGR